MPSWLGSGLDEELELPLDPGDYKVTPGERWTVTLLKNGETVYKGIGPVEVVRSPALLACVPAPFAHLQELSSDGCMNWPQNSAADRCPLTI
jgi:hypothetical protein